MPANRLLRLVNGVITDVAAIVIGGTPTQAGAIIAADDTGHIDMGWFPTGIGADVYSGTAPSALTAGQFVAVTSTGSVVAASAASSGPLASGFVTSAVNAGNTATVYRIGKNTALGTLTPGATYFLSDSQPGGVTTTAPTNTGSYVQQLGTADNATTIDFVRVPAILRG